MLSITAIEDLLIARVKERLSYLATVESYAGQVDWADEIPLIVLRPPGVLVMLSERKKVGGGFEGEEDLGYTFSLGVICRNLRGEAAGRRDAAGAYQILEDLRLALTGYRLDMDLLPLEFVREEIKFASKEYVMYAADYALVYETEP